MNNPTSGTVSVPREFLHRLFMDAEMSAENFSELRAILAQPDQHADQAVDEDKSAALEKALQSIARIPGDSVNYHATHMSRIARAAIAASVRAAGMPEGYCIMPRRLTAENGAKALLLGEFKLNVTMECPECRELDDPAEGCEICDGEGEYGHSHTISWEQIKHIYSVAVKGLAMDVARVNGEQP